MIGLLFVGGAVVATVLAMAGGSPPRKKRKAPTQPAATVEVPGPSGYPDGTVAPVAVPITPEGTTLEPVVAPPVVTVPLMGAPSTPEPLSSSEDVNREQAGPVEMPPSPAPTITDEPVAPLAQAEMAADTDPQGTVGLARILLVREQAPGWKVDLGPDVAAWQARVGLLDDEQFGLDSLKRMAEEVGILPLVRYWPKRIASKKQALAEYRAIVQKVMRELEKHAPASDMHVKALAFSMGREKAQTFGANPGPQPVLREIAEFLEEVEE